MERTGSFFGIGVGPGDPELISYKAIRLIRECAVLTAPRTKSGKMAALDIVRQVTDLSDKEIVPVDFLMQKDPVLRREMYERIFGEICAFLDEGKDVAMITLGDVTIYSTVAYVLEELKTRGYRVGMVPGVTSFSAVASRLSIGLTDRDEPLIVIPASVVGPELEDYLRLRGTKVLMKAGKRMGAVLETLSMLGLLEKAAMVVNCGMTGEVVYETLAGIDAGTVEAGYFATVIVRG